MDRSRVSRLGELERPRLLQPDHLACLLEESQLMERLGPLRDQPVLHLQGEIRLIE